MCINVCEIVRIEFCVCVCVNVKVKVKVMYQIQHEYIKNAKPSETVGMIAVFLWTAASPTDEKHEIIFQFLNGDQITHFWLAS